MDAVAHCMRVCEAFNAAVVAFDAEQARRHRTRRFAAAGVVYTMPEADVKHLVPPDLRFDLGICLLYMAGVRVLWCSTHPHPHRLRLRSRPAHGF